jgi:hypothetical protein
MSAGVCGAATFTDRFDYPEWSAGEPNWSTDSVAWSVQDGRMTSEGGAKSFLVLERLGHGGRVTVEATVTLTGRTGDGWAIAGVALHHGDADHWHLALVEAPSAQDNARSVELTESYQGRWLANYEGATALARTADVGAGFRWEYDHPYRLRLQVTPEGIDGKVMEPDGTIRRHLAYRFEAGRPAVTGGAAAIDNAVFTAQFDDVRAEVADPIPAPTREEPRADFPAYAVPGYTEVQGEATGFFHPEKHGNTWWLIDPNGQGFFVVGTDHIRYRGHWCEALGYAPYGRNAEAKYGSEEAWADAQAQRLRDWGFNALVAGHSELLRYRHMAHMEWLGAGRSFADIDNIAPRTTWTGFPNVFSPRWERHCDNVARRICAPNRNDPWLIGYFLDNELQWFGELTNWRSETGLWAEAWKKPADHTAKQALVRIAREQAGDIAAFNAAWGTAFASFEALAESTEPPSPPSAGAEAMARSFVREVAERYFRTCAEAIRRHDPNHLVVGCRFAGWAPADIWDICGEYCDIVTFNNYPRIDVDRGVPRPLVEEYQRIHELAQKPLWTTEWSFPALDSGLPCRHGAGMRVATQAQKARCYRAYQSTLFSLPFFVGSDYFMYLDEPELGISSTFPEDSNYGLINVSDEPWPELTQTAAEINPTVCSLHAEGDLQYVFDPAPITWDVSLPARRAGSPRLPATLAAGELVLRPAEGPAAWTMVYGGVELGTYEALIHEKVPGDLWVRPEEHEVSAVYEDDEFMVVDVTFTHSGEGEAITQFDRETGRRVEQLNRPAAYRTAYRFWIPKAGSGWFGVHDLWVENTDRAPWTLAAAFHYTRPAIGGSRDGDDGARMNVPNFFIRLGAWEDEAAGYGQAVIALGEQPTIGYWKAEDGFHSDCRRPIGVELQPGQRYEEPGPIAIHFGYRAGEDGDLLQRVDQVRDEAMSYLR